METVTEDDIVIIEPRRKRGRPKKTDAAPKRTPRRDADSETRLRKARLLVARGTPRKVIIRKLKLTEEEVKALELWARGRR